MKSLDEVLSYSNTAIPRVFRETFDISEEETEDIFRETKKFLWICALSRAEFSIDSVGIPEKIFVHKSMLVIDQLWHIFINHTRLYTDFCEQYLDGYAHHCPREPGSKGPTEDQSELQLSYIYDRLGEETLVKWYETYEEQYSPAKLQKLLKPQDFDTSDEEA
jgi:hypothetical protein